MDQTSFFYIKIEMQRKVN